MPETFDLTIDNAATWWASDFASLDDIAVGLTRHQRDALTWFARSVRGANRSWYDLTSDDEALPALTSTLATIRHEVYRGRGVVLLRGLPFDELDEDEAAVIAWAVGAHFGRRASQNAYGDLLGRVELNRERDDAWRGYGKSTPSGFHTDHVDGLGLACVRPAASGGASRLLSAGAVHNVMAEERPDLLRALYCGAPMHWYGEPPSPGETVSDFTVPVFSQSQGRIVCVFLPSYMRAAAEETGGTLDPDLEAAFSLFKEISERDGMALEIDLASGDMIVIDNKAVLHGRRAFDADAESAANRLLYRLWFEVEPARPAHAGVVAYYEGLKRAYRDPVLKSA
ncbi:MAG: TauD/TfdA family dioxygenase [Pseudomonadota bacterium]